MQTFNGSQVAFRGILSQLVPYLSGQTLDTLLQSINSDLTPVLGVTATSSPSHVVNIASSVISNPESSRQRSMTFIQRNLPVFAGGTVTFPSASGGTITASTGATATLTCPSGNFCQVLLSLDVSGVIQISTGTPGASSSLATIPSPSSNQLPFAFVTVQNVSGVIQTIPQNMITQLVGGGGGSGTGGGASASPAEGFQFLIQDTFPTSPVTAGSYVNSTNTSATYLSSGPIYQLLCDKTRTFTTTGTACTASAAPSFTVTPGCIVWSNTLTTFRKIITVTSQTSYVLDAAFPSNLAASAGMVSQAVFTNDLSSVGDATHQHRGVDIFPSTAVQQINLAYEDSTTSADAVFNPVATAEIVFAGANTTAGGTSNGIPLTNAFAGIFARPSSAGQINNYAMGGTGQKLFLVFFANPNNGAVTTLTNLLNYSCSMYSATTLNNGGYLSSAFVMTDGSGTPINATQAVVGGFTQVTTSWSYVPGLNVGTPDGDLEVIVEGSIIPRFFAGVTGQYYTEIGPNLIQLSANYSTLSYSVQVRRRQGSIDTASANSQFIFNLTGVYFPFAGSSAPNGFLLCNGAAISRTTYGALFAVIGTTYGIGDGSTTFNLPNTAGLVLVGIGGAIGAALGGTGGEATHTLSVGEMPSHQHEDVITDALAYQFGSGSTFNGLNGSGTRTAPSHLTSPVGGGAAHNNVQPYLACNYIIKY